MKIVSVNQNLLSRVQNRSVGKPRFVKPSHQVDSRVHRAPDHASEFVHPRRFGTDPRDFFGAGRFGTEEEAAIAPKELDRQLLGLHLLSAELEVGLWNDRDVTVPLLTGPTLTIVRQISTKPDPSIHIEAKTVHDLLKGNPKEGIRKNISKAADYLLSVGDVSRIMAISRDPILQPLEAYLWPLVLSAGQLNRVAQFLKKLYDETPNPYQASLVTWTVAQLESLPGVQLKANSFFRYTRVSQILNGMVEQGATEFVDACLHRAFKVDHDSVRGDEATLRKAYDMLSVAYEGTGRYLDPSEDRTNGVLFVLVQEEVPEDPEPTGFLASIKAFYNRQTLFKPYYNITSALFRSCVSSLAQQTIIHRMQERNSMADEAVLLRLVENVRQYTMDEQSRDVTWERIQEDCEYFGLAAHKVGDDVVITHAHEPFTAPKDVDFVENEVVDARAELVLQEQMRIRDQMRISLDPYHQRLDDIRQDLEDGDVVMAKRGLLQANADPRVSWRRIALSLRQEEVARICAAAEPRELAVFVQGLFAGRLSAADDEFLDDPFLTEQRISNSLLNILGQLPLSDEGDAEGLTLDEFLRFVLTEREFRSVGVTLMVMHMNVDIEVGMKLDRAYEMIRDERWYHFHTVAIEGRLTARDTPLPGARGKETADDRVRRELNKLDLIADDVSRAHHDHDTVGEHRAVLELGLLLRDETISYELKQACGRYLVGYAVCSDANGAYRMQPRKALTPLGGKLHGELGMQVDYWAEPDLVEGKQRADACVRARNVRTLVDMVAAHDHNSKYALNCLIRDFDDSDLFKDFGVDFSGMLLSESHTFHDRNLTARQAQDIYRNGGTIVGSSLVGQNLNGIDVENIDFFGVQLSPDQVKWVLEQGCSVYGVNSETFHINWYLLIKEPAIPGLIRTLLKDCEELQKNSRRHFRPTDRYRAFVRDALVCIGEPAIAPIIALLSHEDAIVVDVAEQFLEKTPRRETIAQLIESLKTEDDQLAQRLERLLMIIGQGHLEMFEEASRHADPSIRHSIVCVMLNWGKRQEMRERVAPILVGMVGDEDIDVRETLATAVNIVGEAVVDGLIGKLSGGSYEVQREAALLILSLGSRAHSKLIAALDDEATDQQHHIGAILLQMGPPVISPLIRCLGDANSGKAAAAENILVLMGEPAVSPLVNTLTTTHGRQHSRANNALVRLGEVALPDLLNVFLRVSSRRHRIEAARVMTDIGGDDVARTFLENIGTRDVSLLAVIQAGLVRTGDNGVRLTLDRYPRMTPLEVLNLIPVLEAWAHDGISDGRVYPVLIDVLGSPSETTYEQARTSLMTLGLMAIPHLIAYYASAHVMRPQIDRTRNLLVALGDSSVRPVCSALEAADSPRVRINLIGLLQDIGNTEATPSLVSCLNDPEPRIVHQAVSSLGVLKDREAVRFLAAKLRQNDELDVQIANALGSIADWESVRHLRDLLFRHPSRAVRVRAIWHLDQINNPAAYDVLRRAIDDEDDDVSSIAMHSLARNEDVYSLRQTIEVLCSSRSRHVRANALTALIVRKERTEEIFRRSREDWRKKGFGVRFWRDSEEERILYHILSPDLAQYLPMSEEFSDDGLRYIRGIIQGLKDLSENTTHEMRRKTRNMLQKLFENSNRMIREEAKRILS